MDSTNKLSGFADVSTRSGQFNNQAFFVQQILNKIETTTIVKVLKCTNTGGLSPVGYVNVQPLVNQMDSHDQGTAQPVLYNVPYMRIQGGANAVIIDPKAGDIGICCFASRDISRVKSTKKQGNPNSRRSYDMGDGLYLGGILNEAPQQYVRFNDDGIEVVSPSKVKITAPSVVITGAVTVNGNTVANGSVAASGDVTANGISLKTHKHGGVATGGGQTGTPV